MKTKLIVLILTGFLVSSFKKDNAGDTLATVEGLSLYMAHEVFGKDGRNLLFEFYETKQYKNRFKLVFQYEIIEKQIIIILTDKIDTDKNKKVKVFYSGGYGLKTPVGGLAFTDNLLPENYYTLIVKTADFEVKSELIVSSDKIILNIPENKYFSCGKNIVYPIPRNLVFGSVTYYGDKNNKCVAKFFKELEAVGLTKVKVPNYPYIHLSVNESGRPVNKHWPNGQNDIKFLYRMDTNFRKVARLAKKWY